MLDSNFARIIDAVRGACIEVYGPRLVGVVLFGSVAHGTMRPDSDIDLLIVAEPLPDGRMPRMDEFLRVEERSAASLAEARTRGVDTRLSPIIWTPDEVPQAGFIKYDIATEGVIVHDPDRRIDAILRGLRVRLEERGAIRASYEGMPYWILEPNLKPGQVVEI